MLRALAGASALTILTLLTSLAAASPTFPAAVQEHLGLACNPDCTTCHTRPEGGLGTARQPFGLAMQQAGLTAGQPSKIAGALDRLEDQASDVDADGTTDIEELVGSTSPNLAGDEPLKCLDEGSGDDGGCAVTTTGPESVGGNAATMAWAIAGFYLSRTWRRRKATKGPTAQLG